MNMRHLYLLTGTLILISVVLFAYKAFVLNFPLLPGDVVQRWDLEAKVRVVAKAGPVKVMLGIPSSKSRALIVDERFVSRQFGLSLNRTKAGRHAVWSLRQAKGENTLYYRATIQLSKDADKASPILEKPLIQNPVFNESELAAAQTLVEEVSARSADTETLVTHLLKRLSKPNNHPNAALLLGSSPDTVKIISVASRLLTLAGLPSRTAWGIELYQERLYSSPEPWLQVFEVDKWLTFNPEKEGEGMPEDLVILSYGEQPFLSIDGTHTAGVQWSVHRNEEAALSAALERGRFMSREIIDFSLFSLPLEIQQVYRVILLIPLGAMLLVILRNVIGLKTFGTFMPVLIALAFRETQLIWGVVLFIVMVSLGLAVRFYLEHLKLLLVPRLGALLIIVVILMAMVSIISHKLGLERGLSIALFPMVIITMTIERMSIVWDERGAIEAMQQGLGSLLVAVLGYLLMFNHWSEHLIFVFPELLLTLLAITLLLGRYSGYRLLELGRFKALIKETP